MPCGAQKLSCVNTLLPTTLRLHGNQLSMLIVAVSLVVACWPAETVISCATYSKFHDVTAKFGAGMRMIYV